MFDTIIIGSGPAGLTAAIYSTRDNLKTLLLGGGTWGGQLMLTMMVDNFPGFPEGILGPELMERMRKQAERFGTELKLEEVTKVDFRAQPFKVWSGESLYEGKSVIIASGADTVWLGLPNEMKLIGKGVSSCAPCDAFFFKGKEVIVVGGGDSAMEETLVLSKFASKVTIVHRRDSFKASEIMQSRVRALPNVAVAWNKTVTEVLGEDKVSGVTLKDSLTGEEAEMKIDGVFVAIGHKPNTKIFEGQVEVDEKGYIKKMGEGYKTMTSVTGVFVAGDVHDHHFRQAVTAAAYGCEAALEVGRYLEGI